MVGITDGEKNFDDMYNRLDSIPECDGRTDRQTSCDSIVRAMHTRRAVKVFIILNTKSSISILSSILNTSILASASALASAS